MRTTDLTGPGLSYRRIQHWIGHGYIPGVDPRGSGYPLDLTDEQATFIRTMAMLVLAGLTPQAASNALAQARPLWPGINLHHVPLYPGIVLTFSLQEQS